MFIILIALLLGSGFASECSSAPQLKQCYNYYKASYTSVAPYTSEKCCSDCQADDHLCAGFSFDHKSKRCQLLGTWDPVHLTQGNCSSAMLRAFPALSFPKAPKSTKAPKGAKNVLFLVADDMRPSISPYGFNYSHTPNMQRIADEGIAFSRAYIQQSYCAPSRNSFMSGRRPDANKVFSFIGHYREENTGSTNWTALPGYFLKHGYNVAGHGKLFHPNVPPNYDQPFSWSEEYPYIENSNNATNLCTEHCCGSEDSSHWCMYDLKPGTYLGDQRNNMAAMDHLREFAATYQADGKPFFVGQGYHKPHLNWEFPKEFLDKIPENVPAAVHRAFPADVPPLAWHECAECSTTGSDKYPNNSIAYFDSKGFGRPLPPVEWEAKMRRAYYACISYVDSLIGDLLNLLDELKIADDTIVTFAGDHGWSLGEHDIWCKMTNSELGTRVPLLFRVPWKKNAVGVVTPALAELVDWYPTLVDLAGLPPPSGVGAAHLGGTSLVPIFDKPFTMREGPTAISTATATATAKASAGGDGATNTVSAGGNAGAVGAVSAGAVGAVSAGAVGAVSAGAVGAVSAGAVGAVSAGATRIWTTVKDVALSQFPRCWQNNTGHDGTGTLYGPGDEHNLTNSLYSMSDCHWVRRNELDFMGYSLRTNKYRYIQWMVWDGAALHPKWDEVVGVELYDHTDHDQTTTAYMDASENVNMAPLPEHKALVADMSALLKKTVLSYMVDYPSTQ